MAHGNELGDLYRRAVWKLIGAAVLVIMLVLLISVQVFAKEIRTPRIFPLVVFDILEAVRRHPVNDLHLD